MRPNDWSFAAKHFWKFIKYAAEDIEPPKVVAGVADVDITTAAELHWHKAKIFAHE